MTKKDTNNTFENQSESTQTDDFSPPPPSSSEFKDNNTANESDNLKKQIHDLSKENEKLKDNFLRSKAETANIHTRSQQEILKAKQFGIQNLVKELLPVVDSLEKAIESCTQDKEGLELTYDLLIEVLNKEGVEIVNPLGQHFDPKFHEAISIENNKDQEKDTVIKVMQTGYKIKDRSIRTALVVVNK